MWLGNITAVCSVDAAELKHTQKQTQINLATYKYGFVLIYATKMHSIENDFEMQLKLTNHV